MNVAFNGVVPVLPAADVEASLQWWIEVCGFSETFRDATPPNYAGIHSGPVMIHLAAVTDVLLAKTVGDQTMIRLSVTDIDAFYGEYQRRGGRVHPNGGLQEKPWGGREFSTIDPNGICITFRS